MSSDCWVMCGGPSAQNIIDTSDDVIAVNKDIFRYPQAKYFITIDNRFMIWEVKNEKELPENTTKIFVANMVPTYMAMKNSIMDKRFGMSYDMSYYDMIIKSKKASNGFGATFEEFTNGGNSGFCAVQLALLLGYRNIHLVGIDLCTHNDKTHHHSGYEKSKDDFEACLRSYSSHFLEAVRDYKKVFPEQTLINHSPVSLLREYLGYTEAV